MFVAKIIAQLQHSGLQIFCSDKISIRKLFKILGRVGLTDYMGLGSYRLGYRVS